MSDPATKPSARGPLAFALMIGGIATIAWMMLHWTSSTKARDPDPETRLCDQAVDALLRSKDLVEVTRAGVIIQAINCGIGKRL